MCGKATQESEENGWRMITLRVEAKQDVREPLMDLALKQNWKLRELHRQLPTLEDVFVELASSAACEVSATLQSPIQHHQFPPDASPLGPL